MSGSSKKERKFEEKDLLSKGEYSWDRRRTTRERGEIGVMKVLQRSKKIRWGKGRFLGNPFLKGKTEKQ